MPAEDFRNARDAVDFLERIGMRVEGVPDTGHALVIDLRGGRLEVVGLLDTAELVDLATYERTVETSRSAWHPSLDEGSMPSATGAGSGEPVEAGSCEEEVSDLSMTELLQSGWEIGRGSEVDVDEESVEWMVEEFEEPDAGDGQWTGDNPASPGDGGEPFDGR